MKPGLQRYGTAILIGVFVFILLVVTAGDIGLTWDEPAYIAAARSYVNWHEFVITNPDKAFTQKAIDYSWTINSEHPPLDKAWSGVVWLLTRSFTDDLTAHRMGNMLLVGVLASLLFLLIRDVYGPWAGGAAVAALLTMPRFFFHAHLAALDVPAAVSVFVVTFIFWKTLERKHWGWDIFLGVAWGLALATKINAIFIPVVFGLWWLVFRRDARLFIRFAVMGAIAIPVFIAAWPRLYFKTFERLSEYIGFVTTDHWEIGQYYLGEFFMPPPWHFGFVMAWAVLPLSLTILYVLGFVHSIKGKEDGGLGWLLFFSALIPILAIATGQSMVYDNERLIMVSFPFLAGLAGIGFGWLISGLEKLSEGRNQPNLSRIRIGILIALAFAPQVVTMVRLYPHLLSYYGESVGGLAGATRLGLETTYWCETYSLALPIINEQANPGDSIWADPWSHDVLIYYQTQGYLRDDVQIISPAQVVSILGANAPSPVTASMQSADWYVAQSRQSTLGYEGEANIIFKTLGKKKLVYEYSFDGVRIFALYQQP